MLGIKQKRVLVVSLLFMLFCAGCATQRVYVKGDLTGPPDYTETQTFWFGGVGQESTVSATEICQTKGKKLSRVVARQTIKDALLTGVTFGIYAPRTIEVSCR